MVANPRNHGRCEAKPQRALRNFQRSAYPETFLGLTFFSWQPLRCLWPKVVRPLPSSGQANRAPATMGAARLNLNAPSVSPDRACVR